MTNLIQRAIAMAVEAHTGQVRKGDGKTPYVLHPLEVGAVLSRYTADKAMLSAAILHDVVEDTGVTKEKIAAEFGEETAELVACLTEDKSIKDWSNRKTENIGSLRNNNSAYLIKSVDALVNMHDLLAVIHAKGLAAWKRFNATSEQKTNYFRMILEDLKNDLPKQLLGQYVSALKSLEHSQPALVQKGK